MSLEDNQETKSSVVALTIQNQEIYLQEDWTQGIGGGLWSTGLALAKYLDTPHAQTQLRQQKIKRVLELGSGNGFLAVCLLASLRRAEDSVPQEAHRIERLVVTDTQEHVALMKDTIFGANNSVIQHSDTEIQVQEYLWGTGPLPTEGDNSPNPSTFDLILGSDLAYRDELHDPLIQTIKDCSDEKSVTLLGVTMNDTKPIFFSKLSRAGLRYERLADHLLDPNFRGTNFGIFIIHKSTAS